MEPEQIIHYHKYLYKYMSLLYNITIIIMTSTNTQPYKNVELQFETETANRKISVGSATGGANGIRIDYDLLVAPKTFEITPNGVSWTDGITPFTTGLGRIAAVQQAFQSVELPPNGTTLWINDTILLQDASMALPSLNINPTNFTVDDATIYRIGDTNGLSTLDILGDNSVPANSFATLGSENLNFNFTSNCSFNGGSVFQTVANTTTINSLSGTTQLGDVNTSVNGTKISIDDASRTIQSDACNINSFNYALPICFEKKDSGTINYGGGQTLTNVFQIDLNTLPPIFFVDSPTFGYTSNIWRIVFTLQTWNAGGQNNNSDKALAYYIEFEDQSATTYKPFMINDITPYCKHNNNSTWTAGGPNSEFQSHSWNDYVDFTPLGGTGSGNFPLRFKIYMGCDNPKDFTFTFVLGLTRTNLI